MKTILKLMCLLLYCNGTLGQNSIKDQVDSIRYLKGDAAFDCNSVIWRIIAKKKEAVPFLIGLIADSTPIPVRYKCKRTNMKVGDMAFYVLDHIISVPEYTVTGEQFDLIIDGCDVGMYEYIDGNRLLFQQLVQEWHMQYKNKLVWQKGARLKSTGCAAIDKITGCYIMVHEVPKPVAEKKTPKQKKK
ncbi:hypothetical protein CJD36_022610 [Flavipsychrobacter stenotrophus]|uniref:Uncharacterized protein n=1 Tax=Flavipsychrobacter stenotrophus TaxID=2077091 RepID=A0A2S7SQ56_9BACT|nr:hypothetical protein [Flavipsychrobacter stenotrophus]PQJ08757.1 hypothetical protein CJD36_022610 [Flavipsychrobacter stenotrophus]